MTTNASPVLVSKKTSSRRSATVTPRPSLDLSDLMQQMLPEDFFLGILCLDRKRAERSGKKLLLVLIDAEDVTSSNRRSKMLKGIVKAANAARRETDPAGWYKQDRILGIIFTELGQIDDLAVTDMLLDKLRESLRVSLPAEDLKDVRVTVHTFSDDSKGKNADISANPTFYPDLAHIDKAKKIPILLKRAMDIVGSAAALLLLAPVFALIAALIKMTSDGPVLFKQERLGQLGRPFMCLKFRSMHANNDLKTHQEFIKQVIKGKHDGRAHGGLTPVYKMTNDPRVTRVGKFLRRTSLDELPQFFNVLIGNMSLVGPRPPIAYEYEEYDIWHRRRVLEVKPGITGLWQVNGRSRVRFDDMVRLDLQYARGWTVWMDIQILLQTPRAVFSGDGAY
jgi:exopolysaccharide biosynthesis polyprenyl glycosylphosphotransferase